MQRQTSHLSSSAIARTRFIAKRYLGAGAEDFLDKTHEFDQLAQAVFNASQHADY